MDSVARPLDVVDRGRSVGRTARTPAEADGSRGVVAIVVVEVDGT